MAAPIVNIKFLADLAQFSSGMQKASRRLDKLGKQLKSVGTTLSVSLTAPIVAFGVSAVKNFDKQAKAIAQVEQGLISTGNAVGFTSDELQKLAADLQENSLFGDEEILKGVTSQLLTFTNIAEQQFKRTQQAALDLATRLDGDLKSASIQLGKALNDPVANLSALSRSGIQFTVSQKQTIKALANTNRLAEAQTIILNELEKQYGGSAAAAARAGLGPFKQLGNILGDLSEDFGKIIIDGLLPFIDTVKDLADSFKNLSPETKKFIVIIGGVAAAIGPLLALAGTILPAITTGFALLTGPVGLVVGALAAIAVIVIKNWAPIKRILIDIANYFIDLYNESLAFRIIAESIITTFENIFDVGTFIFSAIGELISLIGQNIKDVFSNLGAIIKAVFTGNFEAIPELIGKALGEGISNFKDFIKEVSADFTVLQKNISDNIQDGINNALQGKKYKLLSQNVDVSELEDKVATAVTNGLVKGGGRRQEETISTIKPEDITQVDSPLITASQTIPGQVAAISEQQALALANAAEFNEAFTSIIEEGALNVASGIGEFVAAFAQGNVGLGSLATLIVGTIADMAIQLGKTAIGIGIALKGIVAAFKSLNPVVAIAAGVALIALGTLAKSAIANIGGGGDGQTAFADGGIVFGPTNALIGEYIGARNNPEVVAPLDRLKDLIGDRSPQPLVLNGGFELEGTKLKLLLKRTDELDNRIS